MSITPFEKPDLTKMNWKQIFDLYDSNFQKVQNYFNNLGSHLFTETFEGPMDEQKLTLSHSYTVGAEQLLVFRNNVPQWLGEGYEEINDVTILLYEKLTEGESLKVLNISFLNLMMFAPTEEIRGRDGLSVYGIAQKYGYTGTEEEFLAECTKPGPQGPRGPQGPQGPKGSMEIVTEALTVDFTLEVDKWSGLYPATQTVEIPDLYINAEVICHPVLEGDYDNRLNIIKGWACVGDVDVQEGKAVFYCYEGLPHKTIKGRMSIPVILPKGLLEETYVSKDSYNELLFRLESLASTVAILLKRVKALEEPEVPVSVEKVNSNTVTATYSTYKETWTAEGEDNERHNFSKTKEELQ